MSLLVEVVGICETCNKGIVLPATTAENEKGRTQRRFCGPVCRRNRLKSRKAESHAHDICRN